MVSPRRSGANAIHQRRLPFRGSALALVATAIMVFCSISLLAQGPPIVVPGTGRVFPDTTNRIIPFSDQIGNGGLSKFTPAQIKFFATHFAGNQKMTTAAAETLRKYNPNFLILHYRLGEELGYGSCVNGVPTDKHLLSIIDKVSVPEWPGNSVVQPDWFYYYKGSKEYDCADQHYLMNLADPGWRAYHSRRVIKELIDNHDDGVFADSYNVPDEWGDWVPPLDRAGWIDSGPPNLETQWAGMLHDFTDYMRARFHGRWLWIPNVGNWITTRDITDYTNVDGAMIEGFAENGHADFLHISEWVLQMDHALSLINLDKIMLMQTYPAQRSGTSALHERLFITGSFLLVKGKHTYLNLYAQGSAYPNQLIEWWPEYMIDLGTAIDPLPANNDIAKFYNARWGVYVRHYAKGIVLVNPTKAGEGAAPIPIALDKTYYEVVGDIRTPEDALVPANGIPDSGNALTYQAVKSLTVCNDCAAILLDHPPSN